MTHHLARQAAAPSPRVSAETAKLHYICPVNQFDALFDLVKKRSPGIDEAKARALAAVWAETSDRIVQRTLDLGQDAFGPTMHIDNRPKAIFELARLMLFLNGKILDRKAQDKLIADHDPEAERVFLASDAGQAMIESTAQNLAEGAWKPMLAKWRAYRPLIERPAPKHRPRKLKTAPEPHRSRMHFVSQFSTKPWADTKTGKFDVHTLGLDGEVRTKHGTPKVWGAVDYLYTQALEARLGELERDGREPFRKLAQTIPLSDLERRFWIAFLATQLLRTPREMTRLMEGTKAFIATSGTAYPTDPAHLARVFETLFTENQVYAQFHKLIIGRTWRILVAASDTSFLKGDNPVALSGSTATGDWSLLYPLTPKKAFLAGPELTSKEPDLFPERLVLDAKQTAGFNAILCGAAETSVISVHGAVGPELQQIIKTRLGGKRRSANQPLPHWGVDLGKPAAGRMA